MKNQLIALAILSGLSLGSLSQHNPAQAQNRNLYRCVMKNDAPTTVVDTPRGRIDLIVWKNELPGGWSPVRRCQEITKRFQTFSDRGALRYVTSGRLNNQPVICVAENRPGVGISCRNDGLLLTLAQNENPQRVMEQLFDISARVRGGNPITRNIQERTILAVDRFLDEVDIVEEGEDVEVIDITDASADEISDLMDDGETPNQPMVNPSRCSTPTPELQPVEQ
ncbi:hypothetical protein IQ215_00015 [Cyanobacterium stanieri LEGE 03274]|uniref:Uncharacterized protein n=1 Tax=Cyanobacterium stanieri LEGE 03274 TaxID=1828756 RepID=A0ABR9UZN3_9CHRO|nr:COP23 domain-containing protein [Cyanobacterium stanieri]MBE9221072.1 hypothetical protein [Cyanobacterium stanieri LEGE 03274]